MWRCGCGARLRFAEHQDATGLAGRHVGQRLWERALTACAVNSSLTHSPQPWGVITWSRSHAPGGLVRHKGGAMRVLVFTTQKGGAGKTTLAASLAVAAARDGERVHAIDVDPQSSLYNWGQRRTGNGITVAKVEPADLK